MEKYHVLWQSLLGPCQRPTGGGWHQPLSREDPGGVIEKLREWLSGTYPQWKIVQNKGVFPKKQLRWCDPVGCPVVCLGKNRCLHTHTHTLTLTLTLTHTPEASQPGPNPTSATYCP